MKDEITLPQSTPPQPRVLLTGLGFGESPRWHDGRLWFCNWGKQEVIAVDGEGRSEVMARIATTIPFCIDWLHGKLLVVSGQERLLLRRESDGSLITHADLSSVSQNGCNEIVVDGRGNIYVNGGGPGKNGAMGIIALIPPMARSGKSPKASPSPTAWPSRPTIPH